MRQNLRHQPINRITVLIAISFLLTGVIVARLFYLQIIRHDYYDKKANKEHFGESEQLPRRGEIFIKDYASNELVRVATNITLDTLIDDPVMTPNKKLVADRIAPIIFDLNAAKKDDLNRVKKESANAKTNEEAANIKTLPDAELYQQFHDDLLAKISQEKYYRVSIAQEMKQEVTDAIKKLNLSGIEIVESEIIAYPSEIADRKVVAQALSPFLETPPSSIEERLKGNRRYVVLKEKLKPEISAQIKKIMEEDRYSKEKIKNFSGLRLDGKYYRYYPEDTLAANVLGFVKSEDGVGQNGQYGIEETFNTQLQGKKGLFRSQKDSIGRQITVGDTVIEPAIDGDSIVLTLDRSIQSTVEKMLAQAVADFRADNGQVIIMEPKTGHIMAMANFPVFNPNNFSSVYETEDIKLSDDQIKNLVPRGDDKTFWFYRDLISEDRIPIIRKKNTGGTYSYKKYKNLVGPEAYQNKCVMQEYEPGSIFKIITMSGGIDDGDVTPQTSIDGQAELALDWNPGRKDFDAKIHNVSPKCVGRETMTMIIMNSCNTGISWVGQKMGRNLLYDYMKKFGFGDRSEIEFDNESAGKIAYFDKWTDGELANHAFGQGITVTPLQMAAAYSAVANKGVLMQPHIVESIQKEDGKNLTTEPSIIQRAVSEKTANTITGMLVNNVEHGDSYSRIRLKDHYIGAKTGTAQTYKHGQALKGVGTTITTVVGFAPIDNPQFVILAKLDHPRTVEWADATAAVLFNKVSVYLFDYFNIPPDKK